MLDNCLAINMTKLFSIANFLSIKQFDTFEIFTFYNYVHDNNLQWGMSFDNIDGLTIFTYTHEVRGELRNLVCAYDETANKLYFRTTSNRPSDTVVKNQMHDDIVQLENPMRQDDDTPSILSCIAPEFKLCRTRNMDSSKLREYVFLLWYMCIKFDVTLPDMSGKENCPTMEELIRDAEIEADSIMSIFRMPYHGKMEPSRKLGLFLFINGVQNNILVNKLESWSAELDDDNVDNLYLTAYVGMTIPFLSFYQIRNVRQQIQHIQSTVAQLRNWSLDVNLKNFYRTVYQQILGDLDTKETEMLQNTIQTISYDAWKSSDMIAEQVQYGAKINVTLPMATPWEVKSK